MAESVGSNTTAGAAPAAGTTTPDARTDAPSKRVYQDVWSRTEPKYRFRATALLIFNLLLFCGLCSFTHWLHFDRAFDFSWASYTTPLKFWGDQTPNLNDFVLYPVSVEQNPMHGVVLGLLVASIVAVPMAIAILYRFPYALPFIAAVLVFAHMPWMALTLVGSCILASVRPFRLSFRFGAALVGMLPVILYLFLSTRGTPSQIGTYSSPDQKLLLAAPWILATIAACTMLGVILLISRLVNYRPGGVGPVVAIMFAAPVLLFHRYVGLDEVSYRVLEAEYGPRSQRWTQDVKERIAEMIKARLDEPERDELVGIIVGRPDALNSLTQQITNWLLRELLADRRTAYEKCRDFIADYRDSRYVPNVLYIQAWVLDLRLGTPQVLSDGKTVLRELYSDYPHVQSEEIWLSLLTSYPDSPLSAAARLRLAQLHLRRGEVPEALKLLGELGGRSSRSAESQGSTQPTRPWARTQGPERSLPFEPVPYMREAQRLEELIQANCDDPKYGNSPLQDLACLDPQRPGYRDQLAQLAVRYRDARLFDNLTVLWAASLADRDERAARLATCVRTLVNTDALAEAMFRLAELEMQARGEDQEARRQAGLARMTEVAQRFERLYWGREAAERLRMLPALGEPPAVMVTP